MAKIIQTQYRENYGSHDWDETGECPQYWKNKGGSTYVVHASSDEEIRNVINYSNDFSEEYVMHIEEYDPCNEVFEPWQDRIHITIKENGTILQSRTSGTEDLRRGLKSYTHTWGYENADQRKFGECLTYRVQYIFENGEIANSEEEAREIFERIADYQLA
jgi:hypothetical protein|tara:strand:+ start:1109 stop:1591 length:483 start_codon:yes stop_codon:yes gene_type:complete